MFAKRAVGMLVLGRGGVVPSMAEKGLRVLKMIRGWGADMACSVDVRRKTAEKKEKKGGILTDNYPDAGCKVKRKLLLWLTAQMGNVLRMI